MEKFDHIISNYINGNISYVKEQAKKLSKEKRKELFKYFKHNYAQNNDDQDFFFNLI